MKTVPQKGAVEIVKELIADLVSWTDSSKITGSKWLAWLSTPWAYLLEVFCHLTRQSLVAGNLLKIHIVTFEV